ncbi:heavy metal translocating P-type ATPase [Marilutibacter chinensis]|uniref:Cadmium-translocating P-type ATPase n=1 Tax=Marilutibacter chinensis TaxID=2912247 RepID=A0ABS9HTD2_9GAMM|nr:heavy metal translocating P-type ATPase [Lysobacter chinensis]MCF7221420.1 cadmium-translocating P-type ATPase [Lysobacter chinensis]
MERSAPAMRMPDPHSSAVPVPTYAVGTNADAGTCYHCGEPLPQAATTASVGGHARSFCCTGCTAAAQWIAGAALEDYYRLRQSPAGQVGTELPDYAAFDRDAVQAEHGLGIDGGREITVLTDAMRCAACAWLIDRALRREPGVLDITANAITGRIRLAWDPGQVSLSTLMARLAALGYRPWLATGEAREAARRRERNRWLMRLGVAGLGAIQAMMLAEALYLDTTGSMPVPTRDFFRWLTFLVSTPVVFYSGWPFLEGMWRELHGRTLGMDTLIGGSTLLAYFASVLETVRGGVHVWYDAAVMFVLLLLIARMLEQRARGIASAQVDALARARPALATRERDRDGTGLEQVPLAELAPGDVVRVAPGEAVPADGVLLDHSSSFDEALLTGESEPVSRQPGDTVLAGSHCRERPARIRLTRTGNDTRLSQLVQLVERAQAARPPLVRASERIAGWFVGALLLSAAAVYAWWHLHEPSRALEVTLAVLVVSCPCALSLAVPAALTTAHGALARIGVLALHGEALEALAGVDRAVFDKTGTLSDGRPVLQQVQTFGGAAPDEALRIAAALERDSRHPLAHAFAHVADVPPASGVRLEPGAGLRGNVDGREWRLGHAAFACRRRDDDGALWLGDGVRAAARFEIRETPRADAAEAITGLQAQGIGVEICSGDGETKVARFAAALGVGQARARQAPERKLSRVRELQHAGHVVAMVGDGLNDAPVLAGADVSLAMADGAALAQRAADFVVTGPSLARIPQAVALARRTRKVIRQNLAWALGYNLLAWPLAASGHVTPWLAALGMALSSLLVTLNALRLARSPDPPRPAAAAALPAS